MSQPLIDVSEIFPADDHVLLKLVIDPDIRAKGIIAMHVLYNDDNTKKTALWAKFDVPNSEILSSLVKVSFLSNDRKWTFIVVLSYYDSAEQKYITIYSERTALVTMLVSPPAVVLKSIDNVTDRSTDTEDSFLATVLFNSDSLEAVDGVAFLLYDNDDVLGKFRKIVYNRTGDTNVFTLENDETISYTALKNVDTNKYELRLLIKNLDLKYAYEIAVMSFHKMLFSEISPTQFFIPNKVPYLKSNVTPTSSPVSLVFDYTVGAVTASFNMISPGNPAPNGTVEKLAFFVENMTNGKSAELSLLDSIKDFTYYDNTNRNLGNEVSFNTRDLLSDGPLVDINTLTTLKIYVENTWGKSKNFYEIEFVPMVREPASNVLIREIKANTNAITLEWTTPSTNPDIAYWEILVGKSNSNFNALSSERGNYKIIKILKSEETFDIVDGQAVYYHKIEDLEVNEFYKFAVKAYISNRYNYDNWQSPLLFISGLLSNVARGIPYNRAEGPVVTASTDEANSDQQCILSITLPTIDSLYIQVKSVVIEYSGSDDSSGSKQINYIEGNTVLTSIVIASLKNSVRYSFKAYVVTSLIEDATSNEVDTETRGEESEDLLFSPFRVPTIELEFLSSDNGVLKFVHLVNNSPDNSNILPSLSAVPLLQLAWKQSEYQKMENGLSVTVPASNGSTDFPRAVPILLLSEPSISLDQLVFVTLIIRTPNPNDLLKSLVITSDKVVCVRADPPYAASEFNIMASPGTGNYGSALLSWTAPQFDNSLLFNPLDNLNIDNLTGFEVKLYSAADKDFKLLGTKVVVITNIYNFIYDYSFEQLGKTLIFMVEAVYSNPKTIRAPVIANIKAYTLPAAPLNVLTRSSALKTLQILFAVSQVFSGANIWGFRIKLTGTPKTTLSSIPGDDNVTKMSLSSPGVSSSGDTTTLSSSGVSSSGDTLLFTYGITFTSLVIETSYDVSVSDVTIDEDAIHQITLPNLQENVEYGVTIATLISVDDFLVQGPESAKSNLSFCLPSSLQLGVTGFNVIQNGYDIPNDVDVNEFGASVLLVWNPIPVLTSYKFEYVIQLVDSLGAKLAGTVDTIVRSDEGVTTKTLVGLKFVSGLSYFSIYVRLKNLNTPDLTDYVEGNRSMTSSELYDNNPEAVLGVSAFAEDKKVTISWSPILESIRNTEVNKYRVYYWLETDSIDLALFDEVGNDVQLKVVGGLINGTNYKFAVLYTISQEPLTISKNGHITVSATPFAPPGACVIAADISVPGAKAIITIITESTPDGSDVVKYNLYRRIAGEPIFHFLTSNFVKSVVDNKLSFNDSGVSPNTKYEYDVKAVCLSTNDWGDTEGEPSSIVNKIIFVKYVTPSFFFTNSNESDFIVNFTTIGNELLKTANSVSNTGLVQGSSKLRLTCDYGVTTLTKDFTFGDNTDKVAISEIRGAHPFLSGSVYTLRIALIGRNPNNNEDVTSESDTSIYQPYGTPVQTSVSVFNGTSNIAIKLPVDENTNLSFGLFLRFKFIIQQITSIFGKDFYTTRSTQYSLTGVGSYNPSSAERLLSPRYRIIYSMETTGNYPSGSSAYPNVAKVSNPVNTTVSLESLVGPGDKPTVSSVTYPRVSSSIGIVKVDTSYTAITNLIVIFKVTGSAVNNTTSLELYIDYRYSVTQSGTTYRIQDISANPENADDKLCGILTFSVPLLGFSSSQVTDVIVLAETSAGLSKPFFKGAKQGNALAWGVAESVYFA